LWVALVLPWVVKSERLSPVQWLGLAFAFSAVVFTLREGFAVPGQPLQWLGNLLGLVAGMFWGLTTVLIRSSSLSRTCPEKLLFHQVALSTVALPLISLVFGALWLGEAVTPALLAALALVAMGIALVSRRPGPLSKK